MGPRQPDPVAKPRENTVFGGDIGPKIDFDDPGGSIRSFAGFSDPQIDFIKGLKGKNKTKKVPGVTKGQLTMADEGAQGDMAYMILRGILEQMGIGI